MNKKQIIRLTESDLHRIVKESVHRVLKEGQGWNFFKDRTNGVFNGEFDDDLDNIYGDDFNKQKQNYIKSGNAEGIDDGYYDEFGDSHSTNSGGEYKPINKGLMGKLGRRAAVDGVCAAAMLRKGYNKLKGK